MDRRSWETMSIPWSVPLFVAAVLVFIVVSAEGSRRGRLVPRS
jgi:hypothetical protein